MPSGTVLIIDDEPQIRRLLDVSLRAAGYDVRSAETGEEGLRQVAAQRPDVVILDLGLPDMDGTQVLRQLREWSTTPVVILSVRAEEHDIVAALDAGADDYLTKPFRTGELLARVRTAMRHQSVTEEEATVTLGNVTVDFAARLIRKHGEQVKLTPIEYSLFALLARNAGRVLTQKYILQQIWGPTFEEEAQYLRVHIAHIRKKLEDDPSRPALLITESGVGYRVVAE